jgi:AraC-like DNA-binding protein
MNNSAHPDPGTVTRSLVSERPRVWKYELYPSNSTFEENLVVRKEGASGSMEKLVGSSEPLELVLEDVTKHASTYATGLISGGTHVPRSSRNGKLQERSLQRVLDRMKADLATDLDLNKLAAETDCSRSHFLRTFRAAMGCSPHRWLTRLRMDQAKTMLRRDSESLIDIALACGFSSHAHFSNTFRQIVGATPSEYRRNHSPNLLKGYPLGSSSSRRSLL